MPSVSFLEVHKKLPQSLSRLLAEGGEGVVVALRRRPFSRLGRPFGLETTFWSLGFFAMVLSEHERVWRGNFWKTVEKLCPGLRGVPPLAPEGGSTLQRQSRVSLIALW